jgi:light-regulated signal transduction histidine kinase (bacteriophytochrome)/CheY-like chemotaxis protein
MSISAEVDLTNCDREPIHIPGSIQPHGCMLVCDVNAGVVLRHSTNAGEILGLDGDINGRSIEDVLGGPIAHEIRNSLIVSTETRPSLLLGTRLATGRVVDIAAHTYKSSTILEFEPAETAHARPLELARSMISQIADIDSAERLIHHAARLIRGFLRYDRVMVYRFEQDGAGKVVSEVKRSDLESFSGQYFPASDIPRQARELYLRNTIRIISDASGKKVAIVPALDASGQPVDLSHAHLRSVSPIHLEYLRNMGVAASMSISVIVEGELWGLIACHHYEPHALPMAERVAAEMFGQFFSLHLQSLKQKRKLEIASRARQLIDRFMRLASRSSDVAELLRENLQDFARLLPADGIGLWMKGVWTSLGDVPPANAIPALARLTRDMSNGAVWGTHSLSQLLPGAEDYHRAASGALAIPLSQRPGDYLFFFRKELEQTLDWAGNPDKTYTSGPLGDRLTPRKSFAIWKETVRRQSQPWTVADRETAEAARAALMEVALYHSEIMADERGKADVRQRMLNEELNHRVKNILAVIKSLVAYPVQEGRSLRDYVASLKGRIQALSFAHDQVVRGDGGGRLGDLLNAELTPYRAHSTHIHISGRPIWLDVRAFSVMALVIHELATNAAKYGSLSRPDGTLRISWEKTATGDWEVLWHESGGPSVAPPSRVGFGTALIDRSIPYDLGGESTVDYALEGIRARFVLPARFVSETDSKEPQGSTEPDKDAKGRPSSDVNILLVEDQMLIAMEVEAVLSDHGIDKVTTCASASEALKQLASFRPDVAVLDVNLGDGTSFPVAEELSKLGIPFLFATGYGDRSIIPQQYADIPWVRKPYDVEALLSEVSQLLAVSAGKPY